MIKEFLLKGFNNYKNLISFKNNDLTPLKGDDFLFFHHKRMITFLFKTYLLELEGFMNDGLISEEYYYKRRKEILDQSNNFVREFSDHLDRVFSIMKKNNINNEN